MAKIDKNEVDEVKTDFVFTKNDDLAMCFFRQIMRATQNYYTDEENEQFEKYRDSAIYTFAIIKPANEVEAMLAAQMVAGYHASMKCFERASIIDQPPEFIDMYFKHAEKLSKMYIEQMLALNKMRGKGRQTVEVRHIHIHEGGQAIVGNINSEGGRGKKKIEEQPHAKQVAHAPEQAMPCQDAQGDKVLISSHEER